MFRMMCFMNVKDRMKFRSNYRMIQEISFYISKMIQITDNNYDKSLKLLEKFNHFSNLG